MPEEKDYVCVRSRDQGVVFGTLVWRVGRECRLRDARQEYSWAKSALTLFDLINKGPSKTGCKMSEPIEEIDMTEICGVLMVPQNRVAEFKTHPAV